MEEEDRTGENFDREYYSCANRLRRIRVRVKTRSTNRPTFVFQLECRFDDTDKWMPVIRADDFHDHPHLRYTLT